jgi:hypothetical protein
MSDNPTLWQMPPWMKSYESMFSDLGAFKVETYMNLYGSKCAHRLANVADAEANQDIRCLVVNAQVGLLVALKGAGLLKDVPPCPLEKKP